MENKPEDPEITPEMIRAGLAAYRSWDPEEEDPPALVFAVFWEMEKARWARREGRE